MGSSIKAILVVLFITLSTGNASATEIGLKAGTLGGPLFSVVCMKDISDKLSADFTVGGFPGIILRAETNLKKYTGKLRGKWATYWQGGLGYIEFYRGKGDGHSLKEMHLSYGMSREYGAAFEVSADFGLFYMPRSLNEWVEDEFEDPIYMAPMIWFGVVYWIK